MRWARSLALVALIATGAEALPDGDTHVSLVPWRVVAPGETIEAPLVLFWIPGSPEELKRSPLLTSRVLTLHSSRCVAMRVARPDDRERLERLHVASALPVAVLARGEGKEEALDAIENDDGELPLRAVEDLVQTELDARVDAAESRLRKAQDLSDAGETEAALRLYREVWADRCMCPRQARVAQRAMRRLEKR